MPGENDLVMVNGMLLPKGVAMSLGLVEGPANPLAPPANYGDLGPTQIGGPPPPLPAPPPPGAVTADMVDPTLTAGTQDAGLGGGRPAFDPAATLARAQAMGEQRRAREGAEAASAPVIGGSLPNVEQVAAGMDPSVPAKDQQQSPAAAQVSPDLSSATYGDALGAYGGALGLAEDAANERAAVEAEHFGQVKKIKDEAILAQDASAKAAEEARIKDAARLAKTEEDFTTATKAFADAKIDRTRMFSDMGTNRKLLMGLSVILSGLGAVFKGEGDKPIPAIDYIDNAIREDVEQQFREKEMLGEAASMARGAIDTAIQTATHRQAQFQLAMAGHTERAARLLDAQATQLEGTLAGVRAMEAAAAIRERGAGYLANAIQMQHAEDQQVLDREQRDMENRRSVGLGYSQLKENKRQFNLDYDQKERYNALDYDLKLQAIDADRNAAIAKAQTEQERADAELRVPDMAGIDAKGMATKYRARSKETAVEIAKQRGAVDTIVAFTDEVIRLKKKYGNTADLLKSEEWQKVTALTSSIQMALKEADSLGALDKGALAITQQMMGGDVQRGSLTSAALDNLGIDPRDEAIHGLEQLANNVQAKFNDKARALRHDSIEEYIDYKPPRFNDLPADKADNAADQSYKAIVGRKTPEEYRAGKEPGAAIEALSFDGGDSHRDAAVAASEKGVTWRVGDAEVEVQSPAAEGGRVTKKHITEMERLAAYAAGRGKAAKDPTVVETSKTHLRSLVADPRYSADAIEILIDAGLSDLADEAIEAIEDPTQRKMQATYRQSYERGLGIDPTATQVEYKQTTKDTALKTKALAGDQDAIGKLVDAMQEGGPRGVWASELLGQIAGR